jgi:hypothetical protein
VAAARWIRWQFQRGPRLHDCEPGSCGALRPALWPSAATRSRGVRPAKSPPVDDGTHAGVTTGNQHVQVGTAPAQRVQAAQHVVADRDVDGAKLEGVQLEGLGNAQVGQL